MRVDPPPHAQGHPEDDAQPEDAAPGTDPSDSPGSPDEEQPAPGTYDDDRFEPL